MPIGKSGIEGEWVTQREDLVLGIEKQEWRSAEEFIKKNPKKTPPYKISRKDFTPPLNHSMLVIADPENDPSGYKIGALARAKTFTIGGTKKKIQEGILGRGAFGVVKTVQWQDGTQDAIKIEEGDAKAKGLTAEQAIMKSLGRLRAAFARARTDRGRTPWISDKTIGDKSYTIQERIAGIALLDYFQGLGGPAAVRSMDFAQRYEIALKAGVGIKELHDKGIVHADIKPANLMINWQGDVAIVSPVDFGFAVQLKGKAEEVRSINAAGTPFYMAPESRVASGPGFIGRGKALLGRRFAEALDYTFVYSKATDVYAFGTMLKKVFKLAEAGSPLEGIIDKMISTDPKERPTMEEVVRVLSGEKTFIAFRQYAGEYERRKKGTVLDLSDWIKVSSKKQQSMADEMIKIFSSYETAARKSYGSGEATDQKVIDESVEKIVELLKENQKRHKKAKLSRASVFNLKVVQDLPKELQDKVCIALGIDGDDKKNILDKGIGIKKRRLLAEKINTVLEKDLKPASGLSRK